MSQVLFPPRLTQLAAVYISKQDSCHGPVCTNKSIEKISRCAQCKIATYCGKECQQLDWKRHKHVCQIMVPRQALPLHSLKNTINTLPNRSINNKTFQDGEAFITTNELSHAEIVEQLSSLPPQGNTLVGVSVLCNLNLAAAREHIEKVIILDVSYQSSNFIANFEEIILSCETKEKCLQALTFHLNTYYIPHYTDRLESPSERFQLMLSKHISALSKNESFLRSDASYEKIRKLFQSGSVAFKQIDLTDRGSCSAIKAVMDTEGLIVDTLYVSNIEEYLPQDKMLPFYDFIKTVTHEGSYLVHTKPRVFQTTPFLSTMHKDLSTGRFIEAGSLSAAPFENIPLPQSTQILHQIPASLPTLFPALQLLSSDKATRPEMFFFQLGLSQNFYTKEQAEKAHHFAMRIIGLPSSTPFGRLEGYQQLLRIENLTLKGFEPSLASELLEAATQFKMAFNF